MIMGKGSIVTAGSKMLNRKRKQLANKLTGSWLQYYSYLICNKYPWTADFLHISIIQNCFVTFSRVYISYNTAAILTRTLVQYTQYNHTVLPHTHKISTIMSASIQTNWHDKHFLHIQYMSLQHTEHLPQTCHNFCFRVCSY